MKNKSTLKNIVLASLPMLLFLLPSCVKYYDLAKTEFPQSEDQPSKRDIATAYRRSERVYDQFETLAFFDAIWLSDAMRNAFVDVYSSKRGLDQEATQALLQRQLEENKHWVTFYILADIRDKACPSLSDPDAALWTPYVQIDDAKPIKAESIKEVDLEPEYQAFFGTRFNSFKTAYRVKFALDEPTTRAERADDTKEDKKDVIVRETIVAKDAVVLKETVVKDKGDDKEEKTKVSSKMSALAYRLSKGTYKEVKLVMGSVKKQCVMCWTLDEVNDVKHVKKDEDIYWS